MGLLNLHHKCRHSTNQRTDALCYQIHNYRQCHSYLLRYMGGNAYITFPLYMTLANTPAENKYPDNARERIH